MTDPGVLALFDELALRWLRGPGRPRDPLWVRALAARKNGRRCVRLKPRVRAKASVKKNLQLQL